MQWLFNGLLLLNNFLENFLEKSIDIFLESGIIITETRKTNNTKNRKWRTKK